jgi:cytochrome oxidase Cu insertion factor (SCO1/SenC/PrrC family)
VRHYTHVTPMPGPSRAVVLLLALIAFLAAGCQSSATPEPVVVGGEAPAFTLHAADGRQVSLSDYSGRPVLLFFHMAMG